MDLEDTALSETSQAQRDIHCVILHIRSSEQSSHRDRVAGWEPRARGWRMGSECLMGTELQLRKMRKFWRGWWWRWHSHANVPNAAELYISTGLDGKFYVYFVSIKKSNVWDKEGPTLRTRHADVLGGPKRVNSSHLSPQGAHRNSAPEHCRNHKSSVGFNQLS